MKEVNRFAKELVDKLKKEGFTIQYYHARSTNSVYLKLDYGLAHSVRISDHKGKKHLKYRYNFAITTNRINKVPTKNGWRYFSPFHKVDDMVEIIKEERDRKIEVMGKEKYEENMLLEYVMNNGTPGFWSNYKFV